MPKSANFIWGKSIIITVVGYYLFQAFQILFTGKAVYKEFPSYHFRHLEDCIPYQLEYHYPAFGMPIPEHDPPRAGINNHSFVQQL